RIVHDSRWRRREAPAAAISVRRRWDHLHYALGHRELARLNRRDQLAQRLPLLRRRDDGRRRLAVTPQRKGVFHAADRLRRRFERVAMTKMPGHAALVDQPHRIGGWEHRFVEL